MTAYNRRNNFKQFQNLTENHTYDGIFMYYIRNEMIVNLNLHNDLVKPTFITKMLRNRLLALTIWKDFVRKPEYFERERYVCVLDGTEHFKMVSPIFKQNIYSGVFEELLPEESPLDFFNVNENKYPLFYKAKVLDAVVEKGGCVFIPSFYWVQSKTLSKESTLLNFEYESHSELTSLLFDAIDTGILED